MTDRPSMDEVLMNVAWQMSRRSTCAMMNVGALFARDGRVLSTGYNGAPTGMAHCWHDPLEVARRADDPERHTCTVAVHAEANAVAFAAKHGVDLDDAELFTTLAPCLVCAQLVINCGVSRVVVDRPYRRREGLDLLMTAGLVVVLDGIEMRAA